MTEIYGKRRAYKKKFPVFKQRGHSILKGSVKSSAVDDRTAAGMIGSQPPDTLRIQNVPDRDGAFGTGHPDYDDILIAQGKAVSRLVKAGEQRIGADGFQQIAKSLDGLRVHGKIRGGSQIDNHPVIPESSQGRT